MPPWGRWGFETYEVGANPCVQYCDSRHRWLSVEVDGNINAVIGSTHEANVRRTERRLVWCVEIKCEWWIEWG